jgi:pimeloyl-ACP methyl ester carboxylesterase
MPKQRLPLTPYPAAYFEQGQGQALVFLHGFLGESRNWLPVIDHLPDFRCIAIDLLGFGDSAKPDLRYTIWHQVEFVHQVLAALGVEKFRLVGHSYGGWTAAAYTIACSTGQIGLPGQQQPFRATQPLGLGLVAPAGIRDDQFVGRYAHLRPLLWSSPWVDRGLGILGGLSRILGQQDSFDQISLIRRTLLQQPVAKSFLRDRLRPEDAIDTVETQLSEIRVPTLVVAAAADETIPLWHCQTYAKGIVTAHYHLLTDAGHDLIQTHAPEIAQQLRQLATSHPQNPCQIS